MKRLSLWLFALAVTATVPAIAQRTPIATANVEALQKISNAAAKDYQANRSKALILAKERGWVIEKTYSNGAHVSLQGLDSKDLPIYYITYHNSRAAATTKTDQLWAGGALGLTLSGSSSLVNDKLGMWDAGRVRESHQELRGRITQKDNPSQTFDAHATHVAGTLMGSGVSQYAKGMAFGLKTLQAYDFNNDRSEMAAAAATGMLVSNHSYGSISGWRFNSEREGSETDPNWEWWGDSEISATDDYKFGYYDAAAAEWDRIAFNAPYYLMVKSAGNNRNDKGPDVGKPFHRRNKSGTFTLEKTRPEGISNNDGFDIIPTYGNAKNILTVGAVNPIANGYNQPSDVSISSFSSYGPTDDGRIKPDIVGNGVAVLSSTSATDITYSSYNGTSMSAPNVAGSVLLLQEHYSNLKNGTLMRAATLKGLVIHTADEAGAAPGPDYIYGWGLLNTAKAANLITSATSSNTNKADLIQENSLNPNQTYQLTVVASGAGPLAFTISWTDPEATVIGLSSNVLNNRTPRLVNDLDIRVSNGSNTFLPWTLNPSNPSEKAKPGDNNLDNVEQILIANAIPGETYTLTVSHKSILKENKKQEYSLIVSGIGGAVYCASKATSTTGSNIKLFTIGTYAPSLAADACTTYRNFASSNISFEPGQSQLLTIDAGFCGTTAPQKAKAFIDWNRDGDFADENEEVLLTGTGPFKATIAAPGNVTAGEKILMRIVLQETADASVITACNEYARGETQDHYIQIIKQQSDIGVVNVKPLENSFCAVPNQRLLVKIRNFGAAAQTNFPVTAIVKKNGIQIAQLTEIYTGSLSAFSVSDFTMSGTFPVEAGASYEFVAETGLQTDGVTQNNKISSTLVSNSAAAAPIASAFRCGTNADYSLTSNNGNNTFWYTSLNATVPIAAGNAIVASSKINNNLFAAQSDFSATIGPANKEFATGGSYNQFSPDVLVTTKAAVVLESARLYIGNSGKITFTATTIYGEPVSSRTIDVKATRTTSGTEIIQPLDPADQGAVYYLGLELPVAGDYKISISYENGASIFRNNSGVYGYPFGITDVFTITGNTANPSSTNFYYYFYDLKVKALGCKSERVPVNVISGTPLPRPTIAIKGHTLESSETVGNNWYLNGVEIPNAKGKVFTPTTAGSYSVKVIKDGCISEMSVAKDFVYDPKVNVGTELTVYPNPSSGVFTLRLETEALEDITFEVYDLMGKVLFKDTIKRINGQFKGTVDFKPNASGVYLLRVQHGNNRYVKKLVVNK